MAQWYVNELSKLTQVSVRTLHHYDCIGLLKPSIRLENRYRLYSEKDLLKLQQILALKFFGFELSQIKTLLDSENDILAHFSAQAILLEEKAKMFTAASQTLQNLITTCRNNKLIPWKTTIEFIEVFRMTQELEKSWQGKVFTPDELKKLAQFEHSLKTNYTEDAKKVFEKRWAEIIAAVNKNLAMDPASEVGIEIGKQCMDLINGLYGTEYADLRHAIWHKGFKGGHTGEKHGLSPDKVAWLDRATDAYWRKRCYELLDQVSSSTPKSVQQQWEKLLTEMCGNSEILRADILTEAMLDDNVSKIAKEWLKKIYNL